MMTYDATKCPEKRDNKLDKPDGGDNDNDKEDKLDKREENKTSGGPEPLDNHTNMKRDEKEYLNQNALENVKQRCQYHNLWSTSLLWCAMI